MKLLIAPSGRVFPQRSITIAYSLVDHGVSLLLYVPAFLSLFQSLVFSILVSHLKELLSHIFFQLISSLFRFTTRQSNYGDAPVEVARGLDALPNLFLIKPSSLYLRLSTKHPLCVREEARDECL
jgi:hypothetical protein